jgi:Tfp pilus assembly protein PilP
MRTLMSLALVFVVAPAVGAAQTPSAQPKPAAPAQAPAAKPAEAAPVQPKPAVPPPAAAAKPAPAPATTAPAKPNPGQPAAAPVEAPAPPPAPAAAPASESYTYDPSGRRDPFTNLLEGGRQVGPRPTNVEGIAGLSVNEISIRGVITTRDGGYIAMILGPNNKTYSVHTGDRFFDGLVRQVNAEGLVIVQEVNDPLSLVKQREVSKKLRSLEAKE